MSGNVEMLPLFPQTPDDDADEDSGGLSVRWSYSRRSLLERCPRQYYYEYYGSATRGANADALKATLRSLKCLQHRHAFTGQILHAAIARFFRLAREGQLCPNNQVVDWALRQFDRGVIYCRTYPQGYGPVDENIEPTLLREYYYRQANADALYSESRARLVNSLRTFLTQQEYEWCRAAGTHPSARIEAHFSIDTVACRIEGRVDLAYCGEDGVNIVDWKIGNDEGATASLQLVAYGLWGSAEFNRSIENVHVYKAYLGSGRLVAYTLSPELMNAGRARIVQDARIMQFLHSYGREAMAEAFTPCAQPAICSLCPYKMSCPAGEDI